jgi:hypothetical protein
LEKSFQRTFDTFLEMARQKQKARVVKSKKTHLLFEEVFRDKGIVVDGAFTPKNFALNKWMVELAAKGKLLIDGMVFMNIDLEEYVSSRFAKHIRIRRIEWPRKYDPSLARCEITVGNGKANAGELMVDIFRDNVEHLQNLCVFLSLDIDVSDEAKDNGFLSRTITDFLELLPQCVALESLCVMDENGMSHHAEQSSLQVKVMQIMKGLPKLNGVEWRGNMVEDKWHPAKAGEAAVRYNLFDYLPAELTALIISDGDQPKMFAWNEQNGVASGLKAVLRNQDKKYKIESLLLPKSFWGLELASFQSFIEPLNAGDIQEIGFGDTFELKKGSIAREWMRPVMQSWQLPPPERRLDLLMRSLSREISVDLGPCKDRSERAARVKWVHSLVEGDDAFERWERNTREDGHTDKFYYQTDGFEFFNVWKKNRGPNGYGNEFMVDMRV